MKWLVVLLVLGCETSSQFIEDVIEINMAADRYAEQHGLYAYGCAGSTPEIGFDCYGRLQTGVLIKFQCIIENGNATCGQ